MSCCNKKIEGTCILLPSLINERLHLEKRANISNELNITNSNQPFPLPWNIQLELLNKNTDKVFRFRKRDPVEKIEINRNLKIEINQLPLTPNSVLHNKKTVNYFSLNTSL